jgi:hypothetical protein
MVTRLSEFTDFTQAMNSAEHSLPYQFKSIFNADKGSSRRLSKKKFKLLLSFDGLLAKILREGEKVYYVGTGVESTFFEQQFLGWAMHYLNRRAFIFTTQRILLIQFKGKYRPWDLLAQISYMNISKVKQTIFANLKLFYTNGKSSLFIGMPKYDRKNFSMIAGIIRDKMANASTASGGIENLCPHCFAMVSAFPKQCPQCAKPFKSSKKAGLLSLVFPGLGDFYLGHTGIAMMEIIAAALVWVSFFMPDKNSKDPVTAASMAVGVFILFVIMHGIDSMVTSRVAKKGIYTRVNQRINFPAKHRSHLIRS